MTDEMETPDASEVEEVQEVDGDVEVIDLSDLSDNKLRAMCRKEGLAATGNSEDLIDRLVKAGEGDTVGAPEASFPIAAHARAHRVRPGEMLFAVDDPFAAGALRSAGLSDMLPCRFDTTAEYGVAVLKNYVLRARGGCREDLAGPVVKRLDKICPGWDVKKKK